MLDNVEVVGKNQRQHLKESPFSVSAVDIDSRVNTLTSISDILNRTTGVKLRTEGGLGSDFDLSINGMSGNSVRYFIDGVPLDIGSSELTIANIPVNIIDRVEIYKGVVPAYLGGDALGGAINLITKKRNANFIDASVSIGSFSTYIADMNAQVVMPESGIIIRPLLGFNYSKNNYLMKDIELWDESRSEYVLKNARRFHDAYMSAMVQLSLGVEKKKWADAFFITASYNKTDKELQTGQIQSHVYGEAERKQHAWSISTRYRKNNILVQGLRFDMQASHTWDYSLTVDSAYRKYNWDGTYINTNRNEITGRAKQLRHYDRPLTSLRTNIDYRLSNNHSLNLNYQLYRIGNHRYDDLDKDFEETNDNMTKHIFGLSYNNVLFDDRMRNIFFLKDYVNNVNIEQNDLYWITNAGSTARNATKNYFGYGAGSRFAFAKPISVKLSFEHTARLPMSRELLGNGTTIYPNLSLKPESSDNYNVGLFGTIDITPMHSLRYELNGFYRNIKDYIHAVLSETEGMVQYDNVSNVDMKGVEAEISYNYANTLQLVSNCTYQKATDKNKYKADGKKSITYNNEVPNRPWLFSNTELTFLKDNIAGKGTRLQLNYIYQYVHWFYLTWKGYGLLATKSRIPTQNIHSVSIAYSWANRRYNISLDCNNIFDSKAYDNFKLQKPGRTLLCKFRVFIN